MVKFLMKISQLSLPHLYKGAHYCISTVSFFSRAASATTSAAAAAAGLAAPAPPGAAMLSQKQWYSLHSTWNANPSTTCVSRYSRTSQVIQQQQLIFFLVVAGRLVTDSTDSAASRFLSSVTEGRVGNHSSGVM